MDQTSILFAPYMAIESAKNAEKPWSVIYQSGAAHGRYKLIGRYNSDEVAELVADALNRQRQACTYILGESLY